MRRIEPEHQPVEQPPPPGRSLDKQPVHLRRQPNTPSRSAKRRLAARRLAVDADDAALAGRTVATGRRAAVPIATGPRRVSTVAATAQPGPARHLSHPRHGGAGFAPVDIAEPGMAQAAARGKERYRLQQIGLAGAVRPGQHDRRRCRDRAGPSGNCGNR